MRVIAPTIRITLALSILTLNACKKEPDPKKDATPVVVPDQYVFDNIDISKQEKLLLQLTEMMVYVKTAHQEGVSLDPAVLKAMFENTGGNANGNFSFSSTVNIKDNCNPDHVASINSHFSTAAEASTSTDPASNGVAGRITSTDGKTILVDETGSECAQRIEKTIMASMMYYQVATELLSEGALEVDNETVISGSGTAMQHQWDEAWGYFGADATFPIETSVATYWAKYAKSRDALLSTATDLAYAFKEGRQAIVVERYDVRDENRAKIITAWELTLAGTAIHYINEAINNFADDYTRNHVLSEAYTFVEGLSNNPESTISMTQIDQVLTKVGTNHYEASTEKLQAARDQLAEIYNLKEIKTSL